jgi:LysM repeat protein
MLSPNLFDVGAGVSQNGGTVYYVLDAGASGSSTGNPGVSGTITAPGTPIVSQFIVPVTVNTPDPDGNVYHEVLYGQTLWSIAIAYETKIDEIKSLNNLLSNDIQPGQRLLVKKVPTPLPALYTPTQGLPTLTATGTATMSATQTVNVIKTESPAQSELPTTEEKQGGGKVGLLIIICALGFAALGTWLGTRKPV